MIFAKTQSGGRIGSGECGSNVGVNGALLITRAFRFF
jgi:hypothetical protein